MSTYRIHPGIGVARLGDSPDEFCITPESLGALPIDCTPQGDAKLSPDGKTEQTVLTFKDPQGRIKRQAARFQIYVYDDDSPEGRPLKIGDPVGGGGYNGTLVDIIWRVYLANKKSVWYEFSQLQGEHGYDSSVPRRNADVTGSSARQRLIIDPGPQVINSTDRRAASFARDANAHCAQTYPPEDTQPFSIDTLGDIKTDSHGRLLVLGGHGRSGSYKSGFGQPIITSYANNDGWFDDTSDGPVMARLKIQLSGQSTPRYVDVAGPAWVIVGYPAYVPQIADMITMTEVMDDLFTRQFADSPEMYRVLPEDHPQPVDPYDPEQLAWWRLQSRVWNKAWYPHFWRDIWPILKRPNYFQFLTYILQGSNYPHDQQKRGTFNPDRLSQPPRDGKDPYRKLREFIFDTLRQPGEENRFRDGAGPRQRTHNVPLMPLLAGDNPITNTLVSKFLRLTDQQLFVLWQWAEGRFIDEKAERIEQPASYPPTGRELDRGVMSNVLGGAFCPGGEVGWIMRNPSIYLGPWRMKADPAFANFGVPPAQAPYYGDQINLSYETLGDLSQDDDFGAGLQPGDLTKHMALPWQADFNECTTQTINVTYEGWNQIYPSQNNDVVEAELQQKWETAWWPAHRPLQVFAPADGGGYTFVDWARGIPQTDAGDLKMVTAWSKLGFVVQNPDWTPADGPDSTNPPAYSEVERDPEGV